MQNVRQYRKPRILGLLRAQPGRGYARRAGSERAGAWVPCPVKDCVARKWANASPQKKAREDFEIKDDPKRAAALSGASIARLAEPETMSPYDASLIWSSSRVSGARPNSRPASHAAYGSRHPAWRNRCRRCAMRRARRPKRRSDARGRRRRGRTPRALSPRRASLRSA